MKKIGLIADTHGYLDSLVIKHMKDCDEIWHAGDFGTLKVAEQLSKLAHLRGVYGNIDGDALRKRFPLDNKFSCEGLSIWMTHIGGKPGNYKSRVYQKLKEDPPDLFMCGHSHVLQVKRDKQFDGMLYINPGAAGKQGMHQVRTIVTMQVSEGKVKEAQAVELESKS